MPIGLRNIIIFSLDGDAAKRLFNFRIGSRTRILTDFETSRATALRRERAISQRPPADSGPIYFGA